MYRYRKFSEYLLDKLSNRAKFIVNTHEIETLEQLGKIVKKIKKGQKPIRFAGPVIEENICQVYEQALKEQDQWHSRDERPFRLQKLSTQLWSGLKWNLSSLAKEYINQQQQLTDADVFLVALKENKLTGFENLRPSTQLEIKELAKDIVASPLYVEMHKIQDDLKKNLAQDLDIDDYFELYNLQFPNVEKLSDEEKNFVLRFVQAKGTIPFWYLMEHCLADYLGDKYPTTFKALIGIDGNPKTFEEIAEEECTNTYSIKVYTKLQFRVVRNVILGYKSFNQIEEHLKQCAAMTDEELEKICEEQQTTMSPKSIRVFIEYFNKLRYD